MNEQWNNALDQVEDGYLLEAASYRRKRHWPRVAAAAAAVLVLVIGWSILQPETIPTPPAIESDPPTEPLKTQGAIDAAPGCAPGNDFWDFLLGGNAPTEQTPTYGASIQEPDAATKAYSVTVADGYPIENKLKDAYAPGEEVTVQLPTVTEHYYILFANGVEQPMDMDASDLTYTYFKFTMPSEDVVIRIEDRWVEIPVGP